MKYSLQGKTAASFLLKLFISSKDSKNPLFRATRPYLSEPADPRPFCFIKILFFFVGVFIIEVSILLDFDPT